MLLSIPMAVLLAVAVPTAQQAASTKATAIIPFVGEEVVVVVHLDLTRWDDQTSSRRVLGKLADGDDLHAGTKSIESSIDALKAAGAKDLFLLFEPADMPGLPTAVVPLVDGADSKAIASVLSGGTPRNPFQWPSSDVIRGAVVAGTPVCLNRIRDAKPRPRPELLAAMAAGGDSLDPDGDRAEHDPAKVDRRIDGALASRARRRFDHHDYRRPEMGLPHAGV